MLAKIRQALRQPDLTAETMLEALNREIVPVLRKVRDAINAALGDETALETTGPALHPTAGAGLAYAIVDEMSVVLRDSVTIDSDVYPAQEGDRVLQAYWQLFPGVVGASASASFQLRSGATVIAEASTDQLQDAFLVAIDLRPSLASYSVYAKVDDGTGDAVVYGSKILVRYE